MNPLQIDLEKELQLDKLPLEQQKSIIESAGESIYKAVMLKLITVLGDKEKEELATILEKEDEEVRDKELESFLNTVPDIQEIINTEISIFKQEGLAFIKALG